MKDVHGCAGALPHLRQADGDGTDGSCAQVIADLKLVRDEAGNEYVALQAALLRASVKHYLSTDGTLWDSMPLKKELRDATFDMAFALVLIMNQVLSHATASVHGVRTPSLQLTHTCLVSLTELAWARS